MEDIFIGIDGGATKCKARVEDSKGQLVGLGMGGPANIRLSVDTSWQSIFHSIEEALKPRHISLQDKNVRFHIGLGLAGCEVPDVCEEFLNRPHPFATINLITDAHAACLGAHGGKDGAIIIVGTGVVGYEIFQNKTAQVGGWGFPHDDEGGGAWLGMEVARLTFQWLDKRTEKSPLLEDVFKFFEHDLLQFVTWANRANSSEFARLAPLVIKHAELEDPNAIKLMQKAALAVDMIGKALEKMRDDEDSPLPCSLFGGIAPFLEPWLCKALRARLVPRQGDANVGAILMVRKGL